MSSYWKALSSRCDHLLTNFGRENFKRTVGLIYNDYYFNHDTKQLDVDYDEKVHAIWDRMYQVYPQRFLDQFREPELGNPLSIIYRNRPVSIDLAASIAEYSLLVSTLDFRDIHVIHEIGGGYGRLAHVILSAHPHITYRLYDIEPSLSLAKWYLETLLPNADLEFLKPEELTTPCDIVIAMDCLHEMTKEQVNNYFEYANEYARYFYYTCWKETEVVEHNLKWLQEDYPVKKKWKPLFLGQHRMRTQFFEALYKV